MSIDATLRMLAKASGLSAADIATAIPKVGAATVRSWMSGDKLPGQDQLAALARAFGVESRPVKPVPPVTRMPSTAGSAIQRETSASNW